MTIGEPFKLNLIEIFPRSDPFLLSKPRQILEKSCESFLVMDSGQYGHNWVLGPPHPSSLMTFIAATYYLVISQLFDICQHFLSSS